MFPSDQVETLEALVDEIKRVSGIGIDPVGIGRGEQVRQDGGLRSDGNGGKDGALGRLTMADRSPAP